MKKAAGMHAATTAFGNPVADVDEEEFRAFDNAKSAEAEEISALNQEESQLLCSIWLCADYAFVTNAPLPTSINNMTQPSRFPPRIYPVSFKGFSRYQRIAYFNSLEDGAKNRLSFSPDRRLLYYKIETLDMDYQMVHRCMLRV